MHLRRSWLSLLALIAGTLIVAACAKPDYRACELQYDGWGLSGGFYPPRPEGPGRLDVPWLYEVALAGSQNEPGGRLQSDFKLFRLVIVDKQGVTLPVTDCIQIHAKDVSVQTIWDTGDSPPDISILPTRLTVKFIDKDNGREIKTLSYPLPNGNSSD